jgi:hypothetical protein
MQYDVAQAAAPLLSAAALSICNIEGLCNAETPFNDHQVLPEKQQPPSLEKECMEMFVLWLKKEFGDGKVIDTLYAVLKETWAASHCFLSPAASHYHSRQAQPPYSAQLSCPGTPAHQPAL